MRMRMRRGSLLVAMLMCHVCDGDGDGESTNFAIELDCS